MLTIFPLFALMCLVTQLRADLSHCTILYSTVEIFRSSATHDWELIVRDLWGELFANSTSHATYILCGINQFMQIHSLRVSVQIHLGLDCLLQAVGFCSSKISPFHEWSPLIDLRRRGTFGYVSVQHEYWTYLFAHYNVFHFMKDTSACVCSEV